ncbi:hypothetical protein CFP56_042175 [Quercus suber]|uniref:ATP synthase F0 subunit 8 n=1 Tax=Quercus suber TaxID=58331 RepID=A0AAW0M910_QUESU
MGVTDEVISSRLFINGNNPVSRSLLLTLLLVIFTLSWYAWIMIHSKSNKTTTTTTPLPPSPRASHWSETSSPTNRSFTLTSWA